MAGLEAVTGGLISAVVSAVVNKVVPYGLEFLGTNSELRNAVSRLQRTLATIKDVLQNTNQQPSWLHDLKDAAYEAEAVLDMIEYQRLKRQVNNFNPPSIFFERSLLSKAREIEAKFADISSKASAAKCFINSTTTPKPVISSNPRETTSLVNYEQLIGRDDVGDRVIDWLLADVTKPSEIHEGSSKAVYTNSNKDIPVLPIYGIGGIGKTTLAQHVFNHENVKPHFEFRIWVYVSENFNSEKVFRDILQSVVVYASHKSGTKTRAEDYNNLEVLQNELINKLGGKRFLIVLDDVWNEDRDIWDRLRNCFKCGESGSKVMVTCRSAKVAQLMATPNVNPIRLDGLEEDDFWLLFKKHAFGEQSTSSKDLEEFDKIGRRIAKKLRGSPLAAKTVGRMLVSNIDIRHWTEVLESELWELKQNENEIMPALLLSYQHLPNYLKPCFTYTSLYPKGWGILRDRYILQWIAHGFVQTKDSQKTIFSTGTEYMDELLNRSLLQQTTISNGCKFILMHDLIYDMARMVPGNDIFLIEDNNFTCIPKTVRHLSIFSNGSQIEWMKIISQVDINALHSLHIDGYNDKNVHAENKYFNLFLKKILCEGKKLKALTLNRLRLQSIPFSLKNLKLLRYLSLAGNPITTLPNSLASLYHMQTLDIHMCDNLQILSPKMKNLINLTHFMGDKNLLDISCLRRLKIEDILLFKVLCTREHTINVLGVFSDLRRLVIKRLENVSSKVEAMDAKLKEKKRLEILTMEWSSGASSSSRRSNDEEVLEGLQPSSKLTHLYIKNYQGVGCPSWMTSHDLPNLRDIKCVDCPRLLEISTSKNIQESIRKIKLENCGQLQGIPLLENNNFFPRCLEILCIWNCGEFGNSLQWTHLVHLKFLKALYLRGCTCIEYLPTEALQSLEKLEVKDCKMLTTKEGMGSLDALASLVELRIYKCPKLLEDLVMTSGIVFPCSLKELFINPFPGKIFFPVSVRRLEIYRSENLESLPIEVFRTVDRLKIWACPNLYPPKTTKKRSHLKHFEIKRTSVTNVKEWLQFLKSSQLNELIIGSITELRSIISDLDGMLDGLSTLTHLRLVDLPKLQSLPSKLHEHLRSLRFLKIKKCPSIESLSPSMFAPSTELHITGSPQLLKRLPRNTKQFVEIGRSCYLVNPATTTA